MSIVIVELHTINTPRLQEAPLSSRVIKARALTVQFGQFEMTQPTVQKLRPQQTLWSEELKQLKINDKILEKYPLVDEYLSGLAQETVGVLPRALYIPGNSESAQILLELQKQPESLFFNYPTLALTPGIVQLISGLVFDRRTSLQQILTVLKEDQMFEKSDDDLFDNPVEKEFTELLEPASNLLQDQFTPIQEEDYNYNIEKVFELIVLLQQKFKKQMIEVIQKFTDFQMDIFDQVSSQQQEVLRFDAEQFLNAKLLEQLGLRQNEFFDIRHIYPQTTLVKLYSKLSVQDKIQNVVDFYNRKQGIKINPKLDIKLLAKPSVVDKFPPNPTYLYLKNIHKDRLSQDFIMNIIQSIYKQQPMSIKKALEHVYVFKVMKCQQNYQIEGQLPVEQIQLSFTGYYDVTFIFPQADHELNKKMHMFLTELDLEWGLISESQIFMLCQYKQKQDFKVEERPQYPSSQTQYPPQNVQPTYSQSFPTQQQTPMVPPQDKIMMMRASTNSKVLRQQATCLQVYQLPQDVKIKDVAGFCKQQRVAEGMAWNLHQPFNNALGPIRLCQNYCLLIFVNKEAMQKAEQVLQTSLFKQGRIQCRVSEEPQDMIYLDQCFQPKDPPFTPVFCVVLKQIRLPPDNREFGDVVVTWGAVRPEFQRVHQENGILYYKTSRDAESAYQLLKNQLFQQHPNDIFRVDYE
ncbi:Conserved_hypothetical protein [Hexamita inflata]|uniref:Uncharacterized protein n=1 Tax=Hexamita inflata TaxID=28002 RepID=A0AA86QIL5_9EUKA|nr:Conserved hypothetical protein [Hexamita inflata]